MKNEQIYRLSPKMAAINLRKQYAIDNNEKVNLFQLVEKMNIKYKEVDIGEGILGACKSKGLKRLIKNVSENYNTSFSSTAIALLKNSDDEVAIFFHDGQKIEWSMKTAEMKYEPENVFLGSQVTNEAILTNGIAEGKVDAEIWIHNPDEDIQCIEETVFFPKIKKLLTIVRIL